ncbi:hypothetical protein AB0N31_04530 [Streptomyces sp. NPDC051051]|uniref:hypothetical protein n=1 Tax=Streptomyces sp. NPDC051051 TaxID=3155666 RepID=UPI003429242F
MDRRVCARAAVAAGAYPTAVRLDALLWHSAAVTCVLIPALHRTRRAGEPRTEHSTARTPTPGSHVPRPSEQPVSLPADEGAAQPPLGSRRGR